MNELSFLSYSFKDSNGTLGTGAQAATYFSPLGSEARVHEYSVPVIFTPRVYQVEAADFARLGYAHKGEIVRLTHDNSFVDMFYLTAITGGQRLGNGRYLFNIEGVNWIGLYTDLTHKGGVYEGSTVCAILQEITGTANPIDNGDGTSYFNPTYGAPFIVDNTICNAQVDGWLPYTEDARENLKTLFQLANAFESRYNGANYNNLPYFTKNQNRVPLVIDDNKIYIGDTYEQTESVGTINVVEHAFFESALTPETLFESSTAVSNELIVFDAPYHSLNFGTLTNVESGANYAIVSGSGTLTGIPYTHTQKIVSRTIDGSADVEKTLDNTLVSSLYSSAMLDRMENYFDNARLIRNALVVPDGVKAGAFLRLSDPLGELVQGFITEQNLLFSGINKSDGQIVIGWQPTDGAAFSEAHFFPENGTLTVPNDVTIVRLVLIQGGKGGWGGYKGGNATHSTLGGADDQAGDGGAVGEGGDGGKVYQIDIDSSIPSSFSITVGAAGTGGAINHGEGSEGGHSTATGGGTTYSSASGVLYPSGYYSVTDHTVYAATGNDGVYAGGDGAGSNHPNPEPITDTETTVTGDTTTWTVGTSRVTPSGIHGGGGAAYGSNGQNGGNTYAGDGANAVLDGFNGYIAPIGTYGSGGIGGNGGGGGAASNDQNVSGGSGGDGSIGGNGGGGLVIALFAYGSTPTPVPTLDYLFDSDGEPLYDYFFERLIAKEN